jgi:hypothetical protein
MSLKTIPLEGLVQSIKQVVIGLPHSEKYNKKSKTMNDLII